MSNAGRQLSGLACLLAVAGTLAGCSNPDAPTASTARPSSAAGSPGEPPPPRPAPTGSQRPADVQSTPRAALAVFAGAYINWTYRTLPTIQKHLAAISVGQARVTEKQAAASSTGDLPLQRGHVRNHGRIVSIARDRTRHGWWVIVTREQTGGSGEYEGLPAAYHVTLARPVHVKGGYAVEIWAPQS